MAQIEFCDNTNCILNQNHRCSAHGVEFDENGSCTTAKYNEDSLSPMESHHDNQEQDHIPDELNKNNKDGWIKYI